MYLPKYNFQWNDGMYQNVLMNEAMQNYIPSSFGIFKESASYAFNDASFFHVADYLSTLSPNQEVLSEEQWKEKGYNESGVKYVEGKIKRGSIMADFIVSI